MLSEIFSRIIRLGLLIIRYTEVNYFIIYQLYDMS